MMDFHSVETNLRESFRVVAAHRPAGELREMDGVSIASAGATFQMFNAAFLSAPVVTEVELDRRVAQAAVHFAARGQRWAYWICDGWLEHRTRRRLKQLFGHYHLYPAVELPGMLAEELQPPLRPLPELDIRRVSGEPVRNDFCCIGSACFNVPLPWFLEIFAADSIWRDFAGYVAYLDGEAVSTAATVVGGEAIGVYNVATVPARQRQGYGEAVMRYALEAARREHGISRTILQSTPQGFPLYLRMGYRTVTRVAVFCS